MCSHALNFKESDNAGGCSYISELHSINLIHKMFNAKNYIYENSITYNYEGCKKLDYICEIPLFYNNYKCSVSVTRVLNCDPIRLVDKKFKNLIFANSTLIEPNPLAILHVWCNNDEDANKILNYNSLEIHTGCYIIVTICNDPQIYTNHY